ncbi:hypothetical protein DSO57_1025211 [Entomophthora muscae]|uniref:Uncharacterized protein n=1 Tax=Entomophthora muscae TaxID=34485 RepID=A0ACC2S4D6_9FUNG|nr:hypothetical protein DSO57_1025211 [Entomophthora muscae]
MKRWTEQEFEAPEDKILARERKINKNLFHWTKGRGNSAHVDTKNDNNGHVNTFNVNTIDTTNQTDQPGVLSEGDLATVQEESDEVPAPMQDPSPMHDTVQSNEDLLKNIQLDHRTVWKRYASSAGT